LSKPATKCIIAKKEFQGHVLWREWKYIYEFLLCDAFYALSFLGRGYIGARTDTTKQPVQTANTKHKWATVLLIAASELNPMRLACYLST
jgi:hypothetical protein